MFICILPFVFPVWLIILTTGLSSTKIYKAFNSPPKIQSGRKEAAVDDEGRIVNPDEVLAVGCPKEIRKRMISNLNTLEWIRHDVAIHFNNAHGKAIFLI